MSLELRDVSLALGGRPILEHVSFAVDDGQLVSLLGQSGAGKSTALRIAAGIQLQDGGEVLLDGVCCDDVPTHKRNVSIVFQDIRLFPNMTVGENIAFPLKMQGLSRRERTTRVSELLHLVQLDGLEKRRTDEVSGGQQQRVALARALAVNPRVLLLDEPFSGLDESLRDEMRELVVRLHKQLGTATMLVTHDANEALMVSDSIVYLKDGRVVQQGKPSELFEHPVCAAVASCFGDCCVLEGALEGGVFKAGELSVPEEMLSNLGAGEGPATLVVRTSCVRFAPDAQLQATVSSCVYCGDTWLVHVGSDDDMIIGAAGQPVAAGSRIRFDVNARGAFLFNA